MVSNKYLTVRDIPTQGRPRERLLKLGAEALSSTEILALILGRGVSGRPVLDMAGELLQKFGDLKGVINASMDELCDIRGMGVAKAAQIKAVYEIKRRVEGFSEKQKKTAVTRPEDIVRLVRSSLVGKEKECFLVVPLNRRNVVLGYEEIVSIGTLDSSLVDSRAVFRKAILKNAASVIIAHNHPSGNTEPSPEDIDITRRLVKAGETLGIEVLDHIIVSDDGYVSLKSRGIV